MPLNLNYFLQTISVMYNFVNHSPCLRVHMCGEFLHVFCVVSHTILGYVESRIPRGDAQLKHSVRTEAETLVLQSAVTHRGMDVQGLLGLSLSLTSRERNVLRSIPSMEV